MQKRKIILPAIAICACLSIGNLDQSASAMVITDSGHQAWSLEEMEELYREFSAEKDIICGDEPECRRELGFKRAEEDPRYMALQGYSMSSFSLSAINPEKSSVRAYFRDIDEMAMEMMGVKERHPLTEARIAWVDSDDDRSFIEVMRSGHPQDDVHEIYSATTETHGENWFPVETEVEIIAPEAHLEVNDSNLIRLFAVNAPSSVLGWVYYDTCVNSPSYEPGMECRRMFDDEANYVYVPFWPEEKADDDKLMLTSITEATKNKTPEDSGIEEQTPSNDEESSPEMDYESSATVTYHDSVIGDENDASTISDSEHSEQDSISDNIAVAVATKPSLVDLQISVRTPETGQALEERSSATIFPLVTIISTVIGVLAWRIIRREQH